MFLSERDFLPSIGDDATENCDLIESLAKKFHSFSCIDLSYHIECVMNDQCRKNGATSQRHHSEPASFLYPQPVHWSLPSIWGLGSHATEIDKARLPMGPPHLPFQSFSPLSISINCSFRLTTMQRGGKKKRERIFWRASLPLLLRRLKGSVLMYLMGIMILFEISTSYRAISSAFLANFLSTRICADHEQLCISMKHHLCPIFGRHFKPAFLLLHVKPNDKV